MRLQSFFVLKLESSRLRKTKNRISISLTQARMNQEIVRISDNAEFRFLNSIVNRVYDHKKIKSLEKQLRLLKSKSGNGDKIKSVQDKIDKMLFIPEILNVVFTDNRHYKTIIDKGLFVNDCEYVRLLSGAGMARRKTVQFVRKDLYDKMMWFLECGRDLSYKINQSKYSAYLALATSGGFEIEIPRIVVVPDYEVTRPTEVDFVTENNEHYKDPIIERKTIDQVFNCFDGQGIITRQAMNNIGYGLEWDYTPASMIFRGAFSKGLLVCMDVYKFAEENGITEVTDIYGKVHQVKDVDVFLSASQFKLSGAYSSTEQYLEECRKRNFKWTIIRTSPKEDKESTRTCYQYIQVLDLSKEQIQSLCQDTIDYLKNVTGDWLSSVLFLIGSLDEKNVDSGWFNGLDNFVKALLYNPEIIHDKYVQNKIRRMVSKKVKESYQGILNIPGNYSFMISDSVAQLEHIFGLEVKGCLNKGEFYSNFWNKKKINKIALLRSPLTWKSEVVIGDVKDNEIVRNNYEYLKSGIVYNIYDDSAMKNGGAD